MSLPRKSPHSDRFTREEPDDAECTFRPAVSNNPFISERTLRKLGHDVIQADANDVHHQISSNMRRFHGHSGLEQRGGVTPSNRTGKSKKGSANNMVASLIMAGMYTTAEGLKRGPPERIGLPMYYFDPFSPPNFAAGTYGPPPPPGQPFIPYEPEVIPEVPVRSENDHVQRPKELAAPALPSWATTASSSGKGGATGTASNKIVIVKKDRSNEPTKPASGGWQSIMAEMQRIAGKINGGGAAGIDAAKEKEKLAPPKRKPSAKKGPGKQSFKDPVEELKHKFAVLRGEVEPDEEEPPPPAAPVSDSPPAADEAGGATATTTPKGGRPPLKRMAGKLNLAAMLEKAKKGNATEDSAKEGAAAAEGTGGGEGSEGSEAKPKKVNAAAALNAMFAARKGPPPAAADPPPATTPAIAAAAPVAVPSMPSEPAAVVVSSAGSKRPMPPPLPSSSTWPPLPFKTVIKSTVNTTATATASAAAAEESGSSSKASPGSRSKLNGGRQLIGLQEAVSLRSLLKSNSGNIATAPAAAVERPKELPEGYYMAAAHAAVVSPFEILAAGETSQELVSQLQTQFAVDTTNNTGEETVGEEGEGGHDEEEVAGDEDFWSRYHDNNSSFRRSNLDYSSLTTTNINKKRLASADLPVPAGYAMTIERLRRSNEIRAERRRVNHGLGLRNWLDSDHLAVQSTITTSSPPPPPPPARSSGDGNTNASLDLSHLLFNNNNNSNNNNSNNHTNSMLAKGYGSGVSQVGQRLHEAQTTSWSTKKNNGSSSRRAPPPPPSLVSAKQVVEVEWDGLDLKAQKWMTSLRSPPLPPPPPPPAIIDDSGDPVINQLHQQQTWQVTVPVEPVFRADEIIYRRQKDRAERQRLEEIYNKQRQQQEKERQRKKIANASAGSHNTAVHEEKQESTSRTSTTRSKRYNKLLQQYSRSLPKQVRSSLSLQQMIPASPSEHHHSHSKRHRQQQQQQLSLLNEERRDGSADDQEEDREDGERSTSSGGSSSHQQLLLQPAAIRQSTSSSNSSSMVYKPVAVAVQQQFVPVSNIPQQQVHWQQQQQPPRSVSPSWSENENRRPYSPSSYSCGNSNSNYAMTNNNSNAIDKRAHSRYYEQRLMGNASRGSTPPPTMTRMRGSSNNNRMEIDESLLEEYM